MHGKKERKAAAGKLTRGIVSAALALILGVFSIVPTVLASTVSAVVVDGDVTYTFSMHSARTEDVLAQAEEMGLAPIGPLDAVEPVPNTTTINIRRGVTFTVTYAGSDETETLTAYLGQTVQAALEKNNITLRDSDEVSPAREELITEGITVNVHRASQVTVAADGEIHSLYIVGGTVADALEQAGISLREGDSTNYSQDEPLFEKMIIRVRRVVDVKITADGETTEHRISAGTVAEALKKCGIELGEHDRLNVDAETKPYNGMEIVVSRVTFEEVTETEEILFETVYEETDELYTDEHKVLTEGKNGTKEVTYKLTYVDGALESREALNVNVLEEAVNEVIARGTKKRAEALVTGGDGTFTDASGSVVSYAKKLTGTCTAYYAENSNITSTGQIAGRGIIAVNPNVIPYGTRMYVTSADGSVVYGYGVAADTGGACMAGDILLDLCYDTRGECVSFGRRNMVIYILN